MAIFNSYVSLPEGSCHNYIYIVFHIIYPLGRPLMYSEFPEPASQHKDLFICCGMNEYPPGNQVWLENPPYIDDFPH